MEIEVLTKSRTEFLYLRAVRLLFAFLSLVKLSGKKSLNKKYEDVFTKQMQVTNSTANSLISFIFTFLSKVYTAIQVAQLLQ